ncbi:hypothetical protein [Rhizobium sp. SSA_523]|uniref:hypothetical protein n=1 Tax=Rhizobium sp. SSA_523 TaxID=2952477 RepID=UPI002091244C|nr:hypothetical protein [Rhizobium sp. SSA_523]MCO5730564.1 hypothetical protein [Rhizobium sp. SSA_523]WKC25601.1 hypothetical protein QTJ18_16730 [Rhizobium sp. SSA_523]
MRKTAVTVLCVLIGTAGAAAAPPADLTVDHLLTLCTAPGVQEAAQEGDKLGWRRMSDADTSAWRSGFQAHNGGPVELVGWKRDGSEGAESLSYWMSVGRNGHQACAYSTPRPGALLDALKARLGPPDDFDSQPVIESTSAFWQRSGVAYQFTQVGTSALVNISRTR